MDEGVKLWIVLPQGFARLNGMQCVVRRGVLKQKQVDELNRAVDDLHLPPPGESIQSQRFVGHLPRARGFRELLDHPAVLDVVLELCGRSVRLDHTYGIVMAAGGALSVRSCRRSMRMRQPFVSA